MTYFVYVIEDVDNLLISQFDTEFLEAELEVIEGQIASL